MPPFAESDLWDPSSFKKGTPRQIGYHFSRLLETELSYRKIHGLDDLPLRSYYKTLFAKGDRLIPISALGYGQRLSPLIRRLQLQREPIRVLDAGSGYGTESLLLALMGAKVIGVELVSKRSELARSRIDFYQSHFPAKLDLRFECANLFEFLKKSGPFDIVWVMEAISHIHPPDEFLALAREKLGTGGTLMISDPNRLNPYAWFQEIKIRGQLKRSVHTRFRDPETGEIVPYGRENRYSVFGLIKALKRSGFRIEEVHLSGFMGTSFLPSCWIRLKPVAAVLDGFQQAMEGFPLFRYLGSLSTIVASKAPRGR